MSVTQNSATNNCVIGNGMTVNASSANSTKEVIQARLAEVRREKELL